MLSKSVLEFLRANSGKTKFKMQTKRGCLTKNSVKSSEKLRKISDNYQFGELLVRTDLRRTNFERKSLADEREAYNGTLSEETRIKQKNTIKKENFIEIQP